MRAWDSDPLSSSESESESDSESESCSQRECQDREAFSALPDHVKATWAAKLELDLREATVALSTTGDLAEVKEELHSIRERRKELGMLDNDDHHLCRKVQAWDFLREPGSGALAPAWSYAPEGVSTHAGFVVGPAIPWVRLLGSVLLFTQVLGCYAARKLASAATGAFPWELWGIFLPVSVLKVYVEWVSLRLFIVPHVWRLASAKLPIHEIACVEVGFGPWLAYSLFASMLLLLDLSSDSLWAGSIHCQLNGPRGHQLVEIWQTSDPIAALLAISLEAVAWVAFVASLLQTLWPLVQTIRSGELTRHGVPVNVSGRAGGGSTLAGRVWNDDVLLLLAEASGLATLQSMSVKGLRGQLMRTPSTSIFMQKAKALGAQQVSRVLLSYLLETCLQLYVQVSLFVSRLELDRRQAAVERAWPWWQTQAVASLSLTMLTTFLKILEVNSFEKAAKCVAFRASRIKEAEEWSDGLDADFRSWRTSLWLVRLSYMLMVFSLFFSLWKFVGALLVAYRAA